MSAPYFTASRLRGTPTERGAVDSLFSAAHDFFDITTGAPPSADDTRSLFEDLPPGCTLADKFVLGFYCDKELVGVADIVRGWNAPHKAIVGLLLFAPSVRERGFGPKAVEIIEALAATWERVNCLRIGVVATHLRALGFWRHMGFVETGEVRPCEPPYVADILVFEKNLPK